MEDIKAAPKDYSFLPHAAVSLRVIVWSVVTGMAIALPVICLTWLIPLSPQEARMLEAATRRAAGAVMMPWGLALPALVIYPLLEEGFYRGLILQMLRRYLPLWVAVLVPTLLFGVTHLGFSLRNAVFALVVGCHFAWLAIRSRSLYPDILCHSAVNLSVLFLLGPVLAAHGITTPGAMLRPLPLAMLAGSLIVFGAGIRILHGEFSREVPAATV